MWQRTTREQRRGKSFNLNTTSINVKSQTQIAVTDAQNDTFELATTSGSLMLAGGQAFAHIQRVAKMFASSSLIPDTFKGNIPNCTIALEMAHRMGANPMAVMQNLYIVHGRPGWSSQFIIACLNQCGKFSPLRFRIVGDGDNKECVAWAKELETGETLDGPPVSISMAKKEGWYSKNGSKWQTMPDLMLRYRAATFFGRLYAPDLLMGMKTAEEESELDQRETVKPAKIPDLFTRTVEADAFTLSPDSPSVREELQGRMSAAELDFQEVAEMGFQIGLNIDAQTQFSEQPDEALRDVLGAWDAITAQLKGGVK